MPERYNYPGTRIIKNRFGIRDAALANELEAAAFADRRPQPVANFTPDLAGLKAVHRHLFQDIYEWAGKTRGEEVTIDGETFTPRNHFLTKGSVQFGNSAQLGKPLADGLAAARAYIDRLHAAGELTQEAWASATADQVGAINSAHPFREGNGRTMRRFIELSAAHYGFKAKMIGSPEWLSASHNAMDFQKTDELKNLITRNTQETQAKQPRSEQNPKEKDMAQATLSSKKSAAAAAVITAAAKAVANIQNPAQRAEAQQALDAMRASQAKLQTAQRSPDGQEGSTNKPTQRPVVRRDRGQDVER